jgi:hypothetical protein
VLLQVSKAYRITVDATDRQARRTLERNALTPSLLLYDLDTVLSTGSVFTEMQEEDVYLLSYSHTKAGVWQFALRSGDSHVVGSPFQVSVCMHACTRVCTLGLICMRAFCSKHFLIF